ncbi:MAG TPA: hypothetical protein VJ208_02015 [Candidatus Nanoarchaeia archaeon]|nr:hypothetical protein [Candidatus Nanoarchaeia archaeon]
MTNRYLTGLDESIEMIRTGFGKPEVFERAVDRLFENKDWGYLTGFITGEIAFLGAVAMPVYTLINYLSN